MLTKELLEYKNEPLMLRAKEVMLDAGLKQIGSGGRAIVFKNRSGEVVKVFEDDPGYLDFVRLAHKYEDNPHFPKIRKIAAFKRHDLQGAYVVKMEPLTEITISEFESNIGLHAYVFMEFKVMGIKVRMEFSIKGYIKAFGADPTMDSHAYKRVEIESQKWQQANPQFVKALNLTIMSKANRLCLLDMHSGNFMKRGDTWIITDPYIDYRTPALV